MSSVFRTAIGTAVVVVPVTVTFLDLFGYVAKVEGASMQPSLNPSLKEADYVVLNKWKARSMFRRGEVVSLISPFNPEQRIIKRIIGLEGDVVKTLSYRKRYVHIPEGHCWVEGDHKGQSMDSNVFGPVSTGIIQAKATRIIWPPHRWQQLAVQPAPDRVKAMGMLPGGQVMYCTQKEDVFDEQLQQECERLNQKLLIEQAVESGEEELF